MIGSVAASAVRWTSTPPISHPEGLLLTRAPSDCARSWAPKQTQRKGVSPVAADRRYSENRDIQGSVRYAALVEPVTITPEYAVASGGAEAVTSWTSNSIPP